MSKIWWCGQISTTRRFQKSRFLLSPLPTANVIPFVRAFHLLSLLDTSALFFALYLYGKHTIQMSGVQTDVVSFAISLTAPRLDGTQYAA
jgi:hypothetical protein